jgi:ribonuclease P protein subunit POP4
VVAASDPTLVGIEGRVVRETANTLLVADESRVSGSPPAASAGDADPALVGRRVRQVPKTGVTFEFRLTEPTMAPVGRRPTADATADSDTDTDTDTDSDADTARPTTAPGPRPGASSRTDEAAGDREAPGTAAERPSTDEDTDGDAAGPVAGDDREGVASVTVDGTRLRARPALRTEQTGVSTWR